ncbi:hypothetical protein F444_18909 [Phytophthora nicotianae P1976]|uniref:Uncharacterized protein n=1 Tax=Phytophthora nicotianae P1976 TaxID=1317066 RepID=A0A080Z9P1_PHYNI|nr:hypothetical protein F444_18909 [Phytophthora nicotianae P1976]
MGGRFSFSSHKRTASEHSGSGTYVASKRFNAKQRMEEMERRVLNNEDTQKAAGGDVANLMAFFREDANRRAETEEKRRREERQERRDAEKLDREERDRIRREENEERLKREQATQDQIAAREERAESKRADMSAENRYLFDERMKLETRERHQQIMLLLSALIPKKAETQKPLVPRR